MNAHDRRFGVEIECGIEGGISRVQQLFGFDGYWSHPDGWSLDNDGSGVELRTPILQGESGFETVRMAMERLSAAGAYVTNADGLHIHHDAPEFINNPKNCLQLVRSWRNNEAVIYEMVAPRRRNNSACPDWDDECLSALERWARNLSRTTADFDEDFGDEFYLDVRNDLNLAALDAHGSIEIRLHEGTLDPDVTVAWIMFGQLFINRVLERVRVLPKLSSDTALLSRIRLSKKAQAVLAEKKGKGHVTDKTRYRTRIERERREYPGTISSAYFHIQSE